MTFTRNLAFLVGRLLPTLSLGCGLLVGGEELRLSPEAGPDSSPMNDGARESKGDANGSRDCATGRVRCGIDNVQERCTEAGHWQQGAIGCVPPIPAIVAGAAHTCALRADGRVQCWGANESGQLGLGDKNARGDQSDEMGSALPAVELGDGVYADRISAGDNHTCVTLDNGQIKCWGSNENGKLGLGLRADANIGDEPGEMGNALPFVDLGTDLQVPNNVRPAVNVAAGGSHTCALLAGPSLKCWGGNDFGQLGLGDRISRGASPDDMGNNLPEVNLELGTMALTAGKAHTCVTFDDGRVKCWGANSGGFAGVLGLEVTKDRGDTLPNVPIRLPPVNLGSYLLFNVVAGGEHTCASSTILLKCWGRNTEGGLGVGDTIPRGEAPGQMGNALPLVKMPESDECGSIALGARHTCFLVGCGKVGDVGGPARCWGSNDQGQLGVGDRLSRGGSPATAPARLAPLDLGTGRSVVGIAAGRAHTCALLDNGQIKCWGDNSAGQLGLGDTRARGVGPGEMGDMLPAVDLGP